MKLYNTQVVFQEFPDEVTLALNISQCPFHCKGCHSQWLWDDKGDELTDELLEQLILMNDGITCVGIMGGTNVIELKHIAELAHRHGLRCGWYTGNDYISDEFMRNFDYVKTGHYDETAGPLTAPTTNQRMYKIINGKIDDITYKFWES